MARRSRAAQKKKRGEILKAIVALLVVAAVIAVGVWLYSNRDVAPDKTTLCQASGPLGHYVVLIDNTDPYRFIQREAFLQRIKTLATKNVPEGYLVSVYLLGSDFTQNSKPVFEKCNPGQGGDKTEMNSNLQRVKKRYQSGFIEPLVAMADSMLLKESSSQSPIFEMLKIAGIGFERINAPKDRRKLIMFSDMIPNTKEFSMYKGVVDFVAFDKSPYGQISRSSLHNVEVEIELLKNRPDIQNEKIIHFWEGYFEKSGASLVSKNDMDG